VVFGGGPPSASWTAAEDAGGGRLPYPVLVTPGLLDRAGALVQAVAPAHRYVVLTDETVGPLHADGVAAGLPIRQIVRIAVPPGEGAKTRDQWARATDLMLEAGCGRDTTVVAVGGGVVTDLAGFVAATFMRGVPVVQVPTTLLAMIDASVGGKTGVDTPAGKNLVGAFHPPAAVLIDPHALGTLPARELVAGLAEALKHGVVADRAYFDELEAALPALAPGSGRDHPGEQRASRASVLSDAERWARLVARSVAIKADIVSRDEREGGLRKVLNFGHTVGHALEALSGWGLLHGEAVAIGMAVEAAAAERVGVAEPGTARRVAEALAAAGLPVRRPAELSAERIVAATRGDKKARGGRVEYALPVRVGAMAEAGGRWSVPVDDAVVLEARA
jgi:3-dehydroquinate synthase